MNSSGLMTAWLESLCFAKPLVCAHKGYLDPNSNIGKPAVIRQGIANTYNPDGIMMMML